MPSYNRPREGHAVLLHDVLKVTETGIPAMRTSMHPSRRRSWTRRASSPPTSWLRSIPWATARVPPRERRCPHADRFAEAFLALKEGGWPALDCDPDYGGQGLPY